MDFYLCWHFPNRSRSGSVPGRPYEKLLPSVLGNYYANLFGNMRDVAMSVHRRIAYLRGATRAYVDALYGSTIPPDLLDSAARMLAVMRSPTMWWTQAGVVMETEGNGCCRSTYFRSMVNRLAGCQTPTGATPLLRFGLPSLPSVVGMVLAPGSASGKHPFCVVCGCGPGRRVCGGCGVGVGVWGCGPLVMLCVSALFVGGGGCACQALRGPFSRAAASCDFFLMTLSYDTG